ncbi:efflux RND transporter periplasmic adaptor subunit [Aquipseudomonas campi]
MNRSRHKAALLCCASLVLGGGAGYWLARQPHAAATAELTNATSTERKPLYWYDPMYPQQKFDGPGKSPFMDMQLVPRYAEDTGNDSAVHIDPGLAQNLGMRLATVTRGVLASQLDVSGTLTLNERDVAIVQARASGFVERVYAHAPGDVVTANAPLADILIPEWAAAQEEFLALKRSGDAGLLAAAHQRLRLTGMPPALIAELERSDQVRPVLTLSSPIGGVLQELNVRTGMTVATGQTLARINGLDSVWLAVAVPEAEAGSIAPGQKVDVRLPAYPEKVLHGTISAILPEADPGSRTLRVRVELPNPDGQLSAGLTARVSIVRSTPQPVLWLPSDSIIRTGRRALVMLVEDAGHYRPQEVQVGHDDNGKTTIVAGLSEGQRVVASGQFLLDSEASLRGMLARPLDVPAPSATSPALHETEGRIIEIGAGSITLAHGPFSTLGMPGMTMTFPLATTELTQGFQAGDSVRFAVSSTDTGLRVERLEKMEGQP